MQFEHNLALLLSKRHENDKEAIVNMLKQLVPEYSAEEQLTNIALSV
jgi:hypothetical protein